MNKKKLALEVLSSPYIKKIASMNVVDKISLFKIIAEETMREQTVDPKGTDNIEKLRDVIESAQVGFDDIKTYVESDWEVNDLDSLLPDIDDLIDVLEEAPNPQPQEWTDGKKKGVLAAVQQKNFNNASFLILGEFQKWVTASKNISDALKKLRSDQRPEAQEQIPQQIELLKSNLQVYLDIVQTSVDVLKMAEAEPEVSIEDLLKELLEAQDVKAFVNSYRKFIPDDEEKQQATADVIKQLFALKNKRPDVQKGDKEVEDLLRRWIQSGVPEELSQVADRVKNKLLELILAAENRVQKDNRDEYDKLLAAIKQAGDMRARMEVVRVRLPQYMTPDTFGTTLKDLDDMKPLIMAIVQGKTALQEATPQIEGTFKEAAQFLTGLTAYYKLADEASSEQIKADQTALAKELTKIVKSADLMDSFNQPLADALREFAVALQKGEEPAEEEPTEEPTEEPKELDDVADIPKEQIDALQTAYAKWVDEFMTAEYLKEQAEVFVGLWGPIKQFSGQDKDALEQMERAINTRTASREEEEESNLQEAPEEDNELFSGDDPPEVDPDMDQAADDALQGPTDPEQEPEQAPEEQKEAKRNILEGLVVLKRHSDLIKDALELYQKQVAGGKIGSAEAFKKYGTGQPSEVIYKFANLLVKDINSIVSNIDELSPTDKNISESLLEVSGEKFSDKLRLVKAVNKSVIGDTRLLIDILREPKDEQPQQPEEQPQQQQSSEPEAQPDADQENLQENIIYEMTQSQALAVKEQALKVYNEMKKIKRYFPSVQPFNSDYDMQAVVKQLAFIIKSLRDFIGQMSRFKDDKQINPTALKSAKEGLLTIKKSLINLLGLTDEGKPSQAKDNEAGYTDQGQQAIDDGSAEEPSPPDATPEEEDDGEEKQAKPMNIGLPANLRRFMTSTQFLMDAKVRGAISKFEPEQQQTLLKFISYLVGYMAPAKNPELNENKQVLITTFSKGLGYEYDEMVKFIPIVNRVDPETIKAVGDILKAGRTRVLFLLQKVSERMSEFNVYGSYNDSSRLKLIQGLDLALEKPEEESGSEGEPTVTEGQRALNSALLEKRLEKVIKNILNNRKK